MLGIASVISPGNARMGNTRSQTSSTHVLSLAGETAVEKYLQCVSWVWEELREEVSPLYLRRSVKVSTGIQSELHFEEGGDSGQEPGVVTRLSSP